ncbi:MAG: hypothetical protein WAN48_08355 [Actinomycetes bacterium]
MGRRPFHRVFEGLGLLVLDAAPAGGPHDASLHVDSDEICPRCLSWIDSADFVRRTGYGLLQHETCPR